MAQGQRDGPLVARGLEILHAPAGTNAAYQLILYAGIYCRREQNDAHLTSILAVFEDVENGSHL